MKYAKIIFFLCLTSCYEGWEYEKDTAPGGGTPEEAAKPIHYVLLTSIIPDSTAFNNPICGLNSSHTQYRLNEWSQRTSTLEKALKGVSNTVVTESITITGDDCESMTPISLASLNPEPWGSTPPTKDEKNRNIIHLRASFWDGDVTSFGTPSFFGPWAGWQDLRSRGLPAESVSYFVLANPALGYFDYWRSTAFFDTDFHRVIDGTAIDQPNPTTAGLEARTNLIDQDTSSLIQELIAL